MILCLPYVPLLFCREKEPFFSPDCLSKKIVLKLDLHDDKDKRKAFKAAATLPGIDSISIDMNEMKMTVIGVVDPLNIVKKLRKFWKVDIFFVGEVVQKDGENLDPMAELITAYQAYYNSPYISEQYYYDHENPPNICVIS